jgi:energy-coupling factor transporter transmembrane protein EcfT
MSSFALYLIGFVIFTLGLAFAAAKLGVPAVWIWIGVIVLIGLGILKGATSTRRPDPPMS